MRYPTFIIIGAARSGTTALYHHLRQHPQVLMSPVKETNFFALEPCSQELRSCGSQARLPSRETRDQYRRLFGKATSEIAIGEASPRYMLVSGTANRIRTTIADAKLIAILRNPVDRAFSAFSMRRLSGYEPCPTLAEAIADEPRRIRDRWTLGVYYRNGCYSRQLQEYYAAFDREQIRVYLYDDLVRSPTKLLAHIYRFIGVDDTFKPDLWRKYNASGSIENPFLRFLWRNRNVLGPSAARLLPASARGYIEFLLNTRVIATSRIDKQTRRDLLEAYRNEILRLQVLIGRDLSEWLR